MEQCMTTMAETYQKAIHDMRSAQDQRSADLAQSQIRKEVHIKPRACEVGQESLTQRVKLYKCCTKKIGITSPGQGDEITYSWLGEFEISDSSVDDDIWLFRNFTRENKHYETPMNLELPAQIPGGSSSSSAILVAQPKEDHKNIEAKLL
ncbi:hypothetical protein Syun_023056 [Stephania yunnanensis]|uniref:Uncharacterized protein n=1 Tax=Stephania yunnanensis TaxID=152371 RepID=A0AAP0FAP2_9MAGN